MQNQSTTSQKQVTAASFNSKISSISKIRKEIKEKVKEDLFRFRTCCADPRASK